MRIAHLLVALTCTFEVSTAAAQTLEEAARAVKPNQDVVVTDVDGGTVRGRIASITSDSIQLLTPASIVIPRDEVRQLDKVGDPIRDGFGKGAIVGGVAGAFAAAAIVRQEDLVLFLPKVLTGAIEFGLFGLLFDSLHKGRTPLYRAPAASKSIALAPLTSSDSRGLAVSLKF